MLPNAAVSLQNFALGQGPFFAINSWKMVGPTKPRNSEKFRENRYLFAQSKFRPGAFYCRASGTSNTPVGKPVWQLPNTPLSIQARVLSDLAVALRDKKKKNSQFLAR